MKFFTKKKVLIGSLIALFVVYFGISLYVATKIVAPIPTRLKITPSIISKNYQDITIQGVDNAPLKGWLFRSSSDKLVILVAGVTQNRVNDDYYSVLIAKELVGLGYNVLMYDNRAHGVSGGDVVTFGIKESQDIVHVVDFAKAQGFTPNHLAIISDSLGSISLLMAAKQLEDVGALIADSPAASLKPILADILQRENYVPPIFHPGAFLLTKLLYQVDIDAIQPIDDIADVPNRKFLFLHAALDKTIPLSDSQLILKQANPESKLIVFPNGEHIETYKSDPQKYREAVFPFLKEELQKETTVAKQ